MVYLAPLLIRRYMVIISQKILFYTCLVAGQRLSYTYAGEHAAEGVASGLCAALVDNESIQVLKYPASFFDRYRPNTAREMVRQVPGFQINDGDIARGFGDAAGNVLINDQFIDSAGFVIVDIAGGNSRINEIRGD